MFGKTHTEELVEIIKANSPKLTDIIKEYFDNWNPSHMLIGPRYYINESDIIKRNIYTYKNEEKVVDPDATNEKIPSGMHKILVDQKVAYLSGEKMVFGSRSDNAKQLETLEQIIGEKWEDTLPELIKAASNKGIEWLHPFVNEDGEFDYMIIEAENVIPIYDPQHRNKLIAVIRFYYLDDKHVKLSLYTDENVTYFELIDDEVHLDASIEVNPAPHFTDASGTNGKSWGKVPFIKFANNSEELSDLHINKRAIDAYEQLVSNTQNTLEDVTEAFLALIGYEGTSLEEFRTNLKRYKGIKLDDGGDIKQFKVEVPTEAYKLQAEMLRKTIITSGQGVDPSPDVIGTAPSGVALEHLYGLLDMKASMLERKFTLALREFMYFIEVYCKESPLIKEVFDYRDVTFTFNKLMLTNEAEIITMAKDSTGIISQTTIIENHPWVKDAALEAERLKEEQQELMNTFDNYGETFKQKQSSGVDG